MRAGGIGELTRACFSMGRPGDSRWPALLAGLSFLFIVFLGFMWFMFLVSSRTEDVLMSRNVGVAWTAVGVSVGVLVGISAYSGVAWHKYGRTFTTANPFYDRPTIHLTGILLAIVVAVGFAVLLAITWAWVLRMSPGEPMMRNLVAIFVSAGVIVAFFVRDALNSIDADYGAPARSLRRILSYIKQAYIVFPLCRTEGRLLAVYVAAVYNENIHASSRLENGGVASVIGLMKRRGYPTPEIPPSAKHTLTLAQCAAEDMSALIDPPPHSAHITRTYSDYMHRIINEIITFDALERTRPPPAVGLYRQVAVFTYFILLPLMVYSAIGPTMVVFFPILFLWVGGAYVVRFWMVFTLRYSDHPVFDYVRWIDDLEFTMDSARNGTGNIHGSGSMTATTRARMMEIGALHGDGLQ